MRLQVRLDGREEPLTVHVKSDDGRVVRADVDGREVALTLTPLPGGRHELESGSKRWIIDVLGRDGAYEILGQTTPIHARVVDERDTWLGTGAGSNTGNAATVAMPGRVVAVLVAPEQAVTKGEPLVVIEAMKMENEVRAPRDGVVKSINVAPGDSVEADQALVELE